MFYSFQMGNVQDKKTKPPKMPKHGTAFAREYVKNGRNGTKAALTLPRITTENSAAVLASNLLRNDKVLDKIASLEAARDKKALMSVEEMDRRLTVLGRVNFKDYYDAKGELKPMSELTDEQAYCLKEVTLIETELGSHLKVKVNDPLQALRTIGERHKLIGETPQKIKVELVFGKGNEQDEQSG